MTTTHLFSNRATAKIAVDLASNDTAITLVPGGGALFPQPGANQFFRLVLQKGTAATDQREYMTCSNVTGDVLTVQRGLEGTPAANFTAGDDLSLVATALTFNALAQKVGVTLQGALEVEAAPTTPLGIATKSYVDGGRLPDAPTDGKDYARNNAAWHALGAAAGLAVPIPISAGGTGGATLPAAQTNLVIGVTTIDDLAPATPKYGDRWIKPSNMTEMVWVPNAGGAGVGVWINPADAASEAYPLAVTKGGTGATDAPTALTNLGGTTVGKGVFTAATQLAGRQALGIVDYTANPFLLSDGTVAAPGLAWASETGLGFLRAGAGRIQIAAAGTVPFDFLNNAAITQLALAPRTAGVLSRLSLSNQPYGSANANALELAVQPNGATSIVSQAYGTATRGDLLVTTAGMTVQTTGQAIFSNPSNMFLVLDKGADTNSSTLRGTTAGKVNWELHVGSVNANAFEVARFNSGGGYVDSPFKINKSDGSATFSNIVSAANSVQSTNGFLWNSATGTYGLTTSGFTGTSPQQVNVLNAGSVGDTAFNLVQLFPGTASRWLWGIGGSGNQFMFNNDGSASKTGAGANWIVVSDARLKSDFETYDKGLAELITLQPKTYVRNGQTQREVGLVAQDVMGAFPEAVSTNPDGYFQLDVSSINYSVINALKEINQRLIQLEHA